MNNQRAEPATSMRAFLVYKKENIITIYWLDSNPRDISRIPYNNPYLKDVMSFKPAI
jgi:hypothetical protein